MEIRKLTQPSSNTSFGMALRRPSAEHVESFVKTLGIDKNDFAAKLRKSGLKQLKAENPGGKNFDVCFDLDKDGKPVFLVRDTQSNEVVAQYKRGQEGLVKRSFERSGLKEEFDSFNGFNPKSIKDWYKFAKLSAKSLKEFLKLVIANPKETLPLPMLTAAKKAQELEGEIISSKKARIIRNQSINEVNKIFDK